MEYMISQDIESVMEIADLTIEDLSKELDVSRISVNNWIHNKTKVSEKHLSAFYNYTYKRGIRLNKIKEQFYREDMVKNNEVLLFHGAKTKIEGEISTDHNKKINDFGNGFYCGESLEQSAMFVATYANSSLYMLKFDPSNLKCKKFEVNREWMLTIALYRRKLEEYKDSKILKHLKNEVESADYIIAPIADNRMFEIIDSFIDGEITDVQCQHCLSATNLGLQYVITSDKALSHTTLLERCYLTESEKEAYLHSKQESFNINLDNVKLARKQYRNQGEYIEDILQ